jgi:hypothetical protein
MEIKNNNFMINVVIKLLHFKMDIMKNMMKKVIKYGLIKMDSKKRIHNMKMK